MAGAIDKILSDLESQLDDLTKSKDVLEKRILVLYEKDTPKALNLAAILEVEFNQVCLDLRIIQNNIDRYCAMKYGTKVRG